MKNQKLTSPQAVMNKTAEQLQAMIDASEFSENTYLTVGLTVHDCMQKLVFKGHQEGVPFFMTELKGCDVFEVTVLLFEKHILSDTSIISTLHTKKIVTAVNLLD